MRESMSRSMRRMPSQSSRTCTATPRPTAADERLLEFLADLAGPVDERLEADRPLGCGDGLEHGREDLVPVDQDLHLVAGEDRGPEQHAGCTPEIRILGAIPAGRRPAQSPLGRNEVQCQRRGNARNDRGDRDYRPLIHTGSASIPRIATQFVASLTSSAASLTSSLTSSRPSHLVAGCAHGLVDFFACLLGRALLFAGRRIQTRAPMRRPPGRTCSSCSFLAPRKCCTPVWRGRRAKAGGCVAPIACRRALISAARSAVIYDRGNVSVVRDAAGASRRNVEGATNGQHPVLHAGQPVHA